MVKEYDSPEDKPATIIDNPVPVFVRPPGDEVARYSVIALPPVLGAA